MLKSPISYYGGKALMTPTLLSLMPAHKTYVEPFVGGGSLYFAKEQSPIEVINDMNGFVISLYRQIKTNYEALNDLIQNTLHDEYTYNICRSIYRSRIETNELEKAYAFWVGANMSFGGSVFDGSFAITTNSNDVCNPATKIMEKKRRFQTLEKRLERTMILQKDALEVISKYNNKDTFIYCDPPYIGANQGHYKGYKIEDFINLLDLIKKSKSKIMVSCYWHDCINDYDFIIDKKPMKTRVFKTDKVEIILRNYKTENNLFNQ